MSQQSAERFNRDMAKREAGNFYWGFISLAHDERMAIYALYNFARQVDDEADAVGVENLPARLAFHRDRISRCLQGDCGDDPILQILAEAVERYSIPETELQMLVDGVEMDFTKSRYRTFDELRAYCNLVASVVGRMCVRIFGFDDPIALERADDLGMALQLTNILRDVREDVTEMGRVYLPQDELERFGVPESALSAGEIYEGWNDLVAYQVARAREFFASGYEVLRHIPRRPSACVATMAGIYMELLKKIERDPALPLRARAALSKSEKLRVVVRSWLSSA
ncbi:MAG: squalene/phytoene synthase family protein [Candidatus Eremiobacteraeota bacterium]|nr:squalene/phytoene synthase family protein [Candidatus Eremiobacteraeota bacterium]MBV9056574.1 squalene/phytoene synthase family protein [Candidatus Eremiobacteraeota bacterium]MBV9699757.1 squalene/phytoene synthase family protein [Candidatus Eremiobacteraeota bacterium]